MCYMWSEIWDRSDYLGLIFLVRHCPSHFLSIYLFVFLTGLLVICGP